MPSEKCLTIVRYDELLGSKDIQMLVMIAVMLFTWSSSQGMFVFQYKYFLNAQVALEYTSYEDSPPVLGSTPASQSSEVDYFSYGRRRSSQSQNVPPLWSRVSPSPTAPQSAPAISSPSSSRGSWSSLFNTSNMRRFMSGIPEAPRDGHHRHESGKKPTNAVTIPARTYSASQSPRTKFRKRESLYNFPAQVSNPWNEVVEPMPRRASVAFVPVPTNALNRPTFSQIVSAAPTSLPPKRVVFKVDPKFKQQR